MNKPFSRALAIGGLAAATVTAQATADAKPTADEQVAGLETSARRTVWLVPS